MVNRELINYIKASKKEDWPDAKIRSSLKGVGWEEEDIDKGFRVALSELEGDKKEKSRKFFKESSSPSLLQKILMGLIIFLVVLELVMIASVLIWGKDAFRDWVDSNVIERVLFK